MKTEMNFKAKPSRNSISNQIRSSLIKFSVPVSIFLSLSALAQDGEALFKQNCAACHKVGGGRLVGPDLISLTTKNY